MKKWILALVVLALFISCDTESEDKDPQVRAYLETGYSPLYFALGHVTDSGYTAVTDWIYVEAGDFTSYISESEGTYHVLYDTDSDHDTVSYYTTTRTIENNEKYTASFLSSGFVFSED